MSALIESDVRTHVREIQNTIRTSRDSESLLKALHHVCRYLWPADTTSTDGNECSEKERKCVFMKNHYANFASFLLDQLTVDLVSAVMDVNLNKYLVQYFMRGKNEDAFIALCCGAYDSGPGFKLSKCVSLMEKFLRGHKLGAIFSEQSAVNKPDDVSVIHWREDGRCLQWETLISEVVALPDKMANKLQKEVSEIFLPQHYIVLVTADIYQTLETVYKFTRLSRDTSLEFVSKLVGKLCFTGHAETFWSILLRHLSDVIREDYIWSRICERIVSGTPDRCVESVVVPLVRLIPWYGIMGRFLGDSVAKKQKLQLLLCTKLVFHRHFTDVLVLQNIIGYLASSPTRQHLFIKLLMELLQVWGDKSSLNHMSYEQHLYLTKAVFICMAFIEDRQKEENREEILRLLMPGIQNHIGSISKAVQRLGMVAAEFVTATVDPDGPKLNFEYEKDEETMRLQALLIKPPDPGVEKSLESDFEKMKMDEKPLIPEIPGINKPAQKQTTTVTSDSELDSDDDLEPYDMSQDEKVTKVKKPKYIRESMEGLVGCEDPDQLEACLTAAEPLIRSSSSQLHEISAEFARILLHLTDGYSILNFRNLRFNALLALAVQSPKEVASYLTEQFYDRNYNIRQRLDILEVLGAAAQELSQPIDPKSSESSASERLPLSSKIEEISPDSETAENWRDIVKKRIESKTRRFGMGASKPTPQAVANRFSPVAGYFMYPLMRNYDRREMTFDLIGEDCMVLGRLMYTLGIVMYAATNIPTVRQMATALLEFIWMLRFHTDTSVRQGLLFAVSMVYLAVPPHTLLGELQQDVLESKNWLEDIVEQDTDRHCKTLAVQALVLLENIIKQEFTVGLDET